MITDNNFIVEDVKLAVKKGSHWMDENHPGWATKIDLGALVMDNCDYCIIGQACMESYWAVIDDVTDFGASIRGETWAIEHGFDAYSGDIADADWYGDDGHLGPEAYNRYSNLEYLWTEEVKKRLG